VSFYEVLLSSFSVIIKAAT